MSSMQLEFKQTNYYQRELASFLIFYLNAHFLFITSVFNIKLARICSEATIETL